MLHRSDSQGVILIGQPAHAWVSGQIARSWGNDLFGHFAPREEVCLAAEQHDLGMASWDAAPTLNEATGMPYSFQDMPRPLHIALWSSAASMVLPQSRYAALLVSLHGTALYERDDSRQGEDDDDHTIRDYLTREYAFQRHLIDSLLGDPHYAPYAAPDVVARNRRLVARFDGISLALCHALDFEHAHEEVPTADGETTITVTPVAADSSEYAMDPWPFAENEAKFVYEGRRLDRTFVDEQEMRAGLAEARLLSLATRLRPRSNGSTQLR